MRTVEAVMRFARDNGTRGAADYPSWIRVETRLRERLAALINAPSPSDIALTKNTSEGLSIIAHGLDWRSEVVAFRTHLAAAAGAARQATPCSRPWRGLR